MRILALALAAVLVLSVAACGRSGPALAPAEEFAGLHPIPLPDIVRPAPAPIEIDLEDPLGDGQHGSLDVTASDTVVNECMRVNSTTGNELFGPDQSLPLQLREVGARVLVIQMQGDIGSVSGDDAPMIEPTEDTGKWDIRRIESFVNGAAFMGGSPSRLTLDGGPLSADYRSSGSLRRAQVCTMPEFTEVTVPDGFSIIAPAWDGNIGGIVAFFASSGLQLSGSTGRISAEAAGFRGGDRSDTGSADTVILEDTAVDQGGGKGEGIDWDGFGGNGRGNRANGAGGGNALCAGGGGGGHSGTGGFGGRQKEDLNTNALNTRGRGGVRVEGNGRLFAGGGGGGGQRSTNTSEGTGGRGGGLVFLLVREVQGTGRISADGGPGGDGAIGPTCSGAGGGGAGGHVVLYAAAASDPVVVSAGGGKGGDVSGMGLKVGPGGGGGGGRIELLEAVVASGVAAGGPAGRTVNEGNSPWEGTDGTDGVIASP